MRASERPTRLSESRLISFFRAFARGLSSGVLFMAYITASIIATGTRRVPYHTTSRTRLSDVTADALRSAAVRLPTENLRQSGTWFVRGHLTLSPEARQLLPQIMGGSRRAPRESPTK